MQISEKELEDFIYEDLSHNMGAGLASRGLTTYHYNLLQKGIICQAKWLRQVDLGVYGRLDIVGYYKYRRKIIVELFELKNVSLTCIDFDQICRYKTAIKNFFSSRFELSFSLYLIGREIRDGHYIHNNIFDLIVSEFEYSLSGIQFETHDGRWSRSNENSFNYLKSLHNAEAVHGYR